MKRLALLVILLIFIEVNIGNLQNIVTLVSNLLVNPINFINEIIYSPHLPYLLDELFKQLHNGTLPEWYKNNNNNHESLVSQQIPKLGSMLSSNNDGWYDFIVIGAGTAGSIVASRLTENASISVLLLEAGGAQNAVSDMPSLATRLARSSLDWQFFSEPQENCFINNENQKTPLSRGKVMGGSSSINAMIYSRGFPKDYDNWATIIGDNSWSYRNILKYFLKSEHNNDKEFCADTIYHNCNGLYPISSNWKTSDNHISSKVIKAAEEFGIKQIDLNSQKEPILNGTNFAQQSIENGNRISVSKAFLESVHKNRKNLDIIAFAFVTQIIFSNRKAIGVKYDRLGVTYSVFARKEVILSAGAIKSPHILLTSGVGPRDQLQKFNIPVVATLPGVGKNFQDHVFTVGVGYSVPQMGQFPFSPMSFISYLKQRDGPATHFDIIQIVISSSINIDLDWPDIQLNSIPSPIAIDKTGALIKNIWGIRQDIYDRMYSKHYLMPHILIYGGLQRPKSRGYLYLQSSNPYVYPLIQPNYLSHPDDIKVLIDAMRWSYRFEQTITFKNMSARILPELTVGCESLYSLVDDKLYPKMVVPNDEYLECHARHMTTTTWHYVGTCKMGNISDRSAVVDSKLQVLGGMKQLRVIDASIMPVIADGNTNAPTMMIAEKGAQMIKDFYNI